MAAHGCFADESGKQLVFCGRKEYLLKMHHGIFPQCIISPNWSAVTFKQVLGRIHRSGGKSPVMQRIVLADGTNEAEIAKTLRRKLVNIRHINDAVLEDGDLI
jgi:hypothetical protein